MSALYRIAAAFTPPETEEDWAQAREFARTYISRAPWLADVLGHHAQIEGAFKAVRNQSNTAGRSGALRKLRALMEAHSLAEECAIYPVLTASGQDAHASIAHAEQSCAKAQFGIVEQLDPMSREFELRLSHLECAMKHHMYEEECMWFLDIVDGAPEVDHMLIAERYIAQFEDSMSGHSGDVTVHADGASSPASASLSSSGVRQLA